jgi:hypothetical protein
VFFPIHVIFTVTSDTNVYRELIQDIYFEGSLLRCVL